VDRQFGVPSPNRLLVADFTYVKLVTVMFVYVAFVIDAYAGTIVGWEGSASKHTRFVESAIRQAAALRSRQGHPIDGAIHHSDAGSQGGFNWSTQHLDDGGVDGQASGMDEGVDGALADEVAGGAFASA
jgi:putative transposase